MDFAAVLCRNILILDQTQYPQILDNKPFGSVSGLKKKQNGDIPTFKYSSVSLAACQFASLYPVSMH